MPDLTMRGVYPILSTPFDKHGNVVFDDLENQVDWIIEQGVHGVGIAMASEVFKLTESETRCRLEICSRYHQGPCKGRNEYRR